MFALYYVDLQINMMSTEEKVSPGTALVNHVAVLHGRLSKMVSVVL